MGDSSTTVKETLFFVCHSKQIQKTRAGEPANFFSDPAPAPAPDFFSKRLRLRLLVFFQAAQAPNPRSQKHPAPAPQPWKNQTEKIRKGKRPTGLLSPSLN